VAEQSKLDFEISVSTRLPASMTSELDLFAGQNFTDRSKTLRAFVMTVWEKAKAQGLTSQSLSDLLRRIRFEPA
jgi:hypothetical protein